MGSLAAEEGFLERQLNWCLCWFSLACVQVATDLEPLLTSGIEGKELAYLGLGDKKEAASVTQAPMLPPLCSGLLLGSTGYFSTGEVLSGCDDNNSSLKMTQLLWSSANVLFKREMKEAPDRENGTPTAGKKCVARTSTLYTSFLQVTCIIGAYVSPMHIGCQTHKIPS